MKKYMQKNKKEVVEDMLVHYAANATDGTEIIEFVGKDEAAVRDVLGRFQQAWDAIETDEEGPTPEQDEELDQVLSDCADEILNLN